jgi:uncharacterized protein (DUF2236 family)
MVGAVPSGLPFPRDSMTWRINMEPVIGLAGGRALLLQVLHPKVGAGVEQHSNFDKDPFRRGFRTADMMLKLAFADAATSRRQAVLLRRMHERVKGTMGDGVAYDAMDPALLLWVWATLVDGSLLAYERGVRPLSDAERERYYEEQKVIAYACGVPRGLCPETYGDFERYMQYTIENELRVTRIARLVAYAGEHPPLPRPLGRFVGGLGTLLTAGLLPAGFRDELGYTWSPNKERLLRTIFLVSRVAARVVPRPIRHLPNRYLTKRKTPLGWWRNRPIDVPDHLVKGTG